MQETISCFAAYLKWNDISKNKAVVFSLFGRSPVESFQHHTLFNNQCLSQLSTEDHPEAFV